MDRPSPRLSRPRWRTYRLVPSHFPPIDLFEQVLDPADYDIAFEIEAMTNDRLRDETGDLRQVAPEDRIAGPGSSPVMAAFTHRGKPSRFTDGSYGVYYAGSSLDVAVAETQYHKEAFLAATQEPAMELTMRCYIGAAQKRLHDIRPQAFDDFHHPAPEQYPTAQKFARQLRASGSNGVLYCSVRCPGGECLAAFKPTAVSIPVQGPHLRYVWNGQAIVATFEVRDYQLRYDIGYGEK